MTVYRITNAMFKNDISGNGAAIHGSRWNSAGMRLLYTSSHISLSILESLVHLKREYFPADQYLLSINIPDNSFTELELTKLKKGWKDHFEYTQWIGEEFLKAGKKLALKVPSVIVDQEHNFILNPLHPDFKKVKITASELLELDKRLLH